MSILDILEASLGLNQDLKSGGSHQKNLEHDWTLSPFVTLLMGQSDVFTTSGTNLGESTSVFFL